MPVGASGGTSQRRWTSLKGKHIGGSGLPPPPCSLLRCHHNLLLLLPRASSCCLPTQATSWRRREIANIHLHKQHRGLFFLSEGKVTSVRHHRHLPKAPRCISRIAPSWLPAESFLGAPLVKTAIFGLKLKEREKTNPVVFNCKMHAYLKCKGTTGGWGTVRSDPCCGSSE